MDALVRRLQEISFPATRLREGYDQGEVDALVNELSEAVRRGEAIAPLVDAARFTPVLVRDGYEIGAVDAFLDAFSREAAAAGLIERDPARALAQEVRGARFASAGRGQGYRGEVVSELLSWVSDAIEANEAIDWLIAAVPLDAPSRREKGLDAAEVDAFVSAVRVRAASLDPGPADRTARAWRIAKSIEGVRFMAVRVREGYDLGAVDRLLDELASAARQGGSLAPLVHAAGLSRTRLKEGYDAEEVDAFLRDLVVREG